MIKTLAGVYILSVSALLAGAAGIWRLRCENFGCIGVGIAWFAWVVSFFVVLGIGFIARSKAAAIPGFAQACSAAWWLQLAAGLGLLATWAVKNSA
jgi:hypothetical protein